MDIKSFTKKKGAVLLAAILLAVIIGLLLTDIVTCFFPGNKVSSLKENVDFDEAIKNGEVGQAFIQNGYAADTMGFQYVMNGGGFVKTYEDNSKRSITVLFRNVVTGKTYAVSTDLYSRPDVYAKLQQQYNLNTDYNYGFYASFSPACIHENGIYKAYIHVIENEKDSAVFDADAFYCKDGTNFEKWDYTFFESPMIELDGKTVPTFSEKAYGNGISVNRELAFAWSAGDSSEVVLGLNNSHTGDYHCEIKVVATVGDTEQRVIISSNGQTLYENTACGAGKVEFDIPKSCIEDGKATLVIEYPDSFSPLKTGQGADPRQLGIAFSEIHVN